MADESKQEAQGEPGAPFPPDAIDPELIALRRRSGGVGPVLSLSVLVFCTYMMLTLRADLRFSREATEPRTVDDIAALVDGDLHDRFVNVRAVPDRAFSAQVSTGEAMNGQRVTPVLGSSDRVWMYTDGNPWTAIVAYNEFHQGRLRAIDDLPFGDGLRAFVERQPPTPRFVSLEALRAALEAKATTMLDPAGSQLELAADTPVTIHKVVPGRAEIVARATADRLDEAAWSLVLTNAGVLPTGGRAYRGNERAYWYRVPAPAGIEAVRQALRSHNLFAVDVRPIVETRNATWGQLRADAGGLTAGDQTLAWVDISRVSLSVGHRVPDEAVILLTNELPGAYWYLLPIYVLMGLFALLFGWALFREIRSMIPTTT